MTSEEKSRLSAMRKAGRSYTEIAAELGISKNTIKTFCRRNGLTSEVESAPVEVTPAPTTERLCPHCGKPVIQPQGRKEKKFCSDRCRLRWWNSHPERITHRVVQTKTCLYCGAEFIAHRNERQKYCSRKCYDLARKRAA